MRTVRRVLGIVWLALRGLAADRIRTTCAIFGVTLAVLSVTLLVGVGAGVVETGGERFEEADRDLWVTGGPIEVAPGSVGGFRNPISESHTLAGEIRDHDEVRNAVPMAFQVVYVSTDGEEFETKMGSGVPGTGSSIALDEGTGFSGGDPHYADGGYDGPMTHEAIVSPEIAEEFDLEVGDSIHVGGTLGNARDNEFEVVGISPTFANFLGTGTVTIRLSELQTLTGNSFDDRATLITVQLEPGADPEAVGDDLAAAHPEYDFRTNDEQLLEILERQAAILAGGVSLVILGVLAGTVLSLNLLLSLVFVQRDSFAVLRAVGATRGAVAGVAIAQALAVATLGCLLGIGLTPVAAAGLETATAAVTGFEGLVRVPTYAYAAGVAVAFGFGLIGAIAGAWRVSGLASTARLVR